MKAGLLFAGQGAQYTGMGKELYEISPAARAIFDRAGADIKQWCFTGSKEELRQTHVTQPAVYTVNMAAGAALFEALAREKLLMGSGREDGQGLEIAALAGFSMGEYAALVTAGSIQDFETGLVLIQQRGAYMAEAGADAAGDPRGGMAAVFGERKDILACIAAARGEDILEAVNFNSPQQTVAAGDKAALERLRKAVKETAGLKAVPLNVGAAFHSSMMAPASEKLAQALAALECTAPCIPVYSNITGENLMKEKPADMTASAWIKSRMALQLKSPVYWQETIENMYTAGVRLFIEVGPGQTLRGLVKKTAPQAAALHVEDAESLRETIETVRQRMGEDV